MLAIAGFLASVNCFTSVLFTASFANQQENDANSCKSKKEGDANSCKSKKSINYLHTYTYLTP